MILYNYHTHTNFSDGTHSPEEMIQAAIDLGFHSLGISDHAYTEFYPHWSIPQQKMEDYVKTLGDLKKKYAEQINLFVGLEQDALAVPLPDGLDYCIGSVHWLQKDGHYIPLDESRDFLSDGIREYYNGDGDALAEDYFSLVSAYADDPKISIIGHFDLVTKFDEEADPLFPPTPRYIAAWQRAARKLINAGKIFEINTGAVFRGARKTPYPHEAILDFLGRQGAKVILSSDCHCIESLNFAFDRGEELIQKYRLTAVDPF